MSDVVRVMVALFVVASWACTRTHPTASGTELVRWDKTMETEPPVLAAKEVGARTSKDVVVVAEPNVKGPVTIKVHFETAPIEVMWDGETERTSSPVAARLAVEADDDWSLSGECAEGLHRHFGQPERMIKTCRVVMKHIDGSLHATTSFALDIAGDGTVKADGIDFKFTVSG
jgi:hypothetical protein